MDDNLNPFLTLLGSEILPHADDRDERIVHASRLYAETGNPVSGIAALVLSPEGIDDLAVHALRPILSEERLSLVLVETSNIKHRRVPEDREQVVRAVAGALRRLNGEG